MERCCRACASPIRSDGAVDCPFGWVVTASNELMLPITGHVCQAFSRRDTKTWREAARLLAAGGGWGPAGAGIDGAAAIVFPAISVMGCLAMGAGTDVVCLDGHATQAAHGFAVVDTFGKDDGAASWQCCFLFANDIEQPAQSSRDG